MSSSSEEQKKQEETPTVQEMMYKTKIIQFFGRTTPIILQNDNGPCPLLAICNILLLRNNLRLSSDVAEVSQEKLLTLVAERIIDSNSNVNNKDAGYLQNQEQNITDAIDLLPLLATGIDVNIKFTRIDDFEFTRECTVFDMLDIPLYHGWIVDPQDTDTANAIGSKSYNVLTDELVALEPQSMTNVTKNNTEKDCVDFVDSTIASLESKTVGLTLENDTNVVGSTEETLITNPGDDLITSETVPEKTLITNSCDDLITFDSVPEETLITNSSDENKDENEKSSIEVVENTENISLKPPVDILVLKPEKDEKIVDQTSLTADVNEVENTNISESKSYESCSSAPDVVLKSDSVILTADGNENEILSLKSEKLEKDSTSGDDSRPKDGIASEQGENIRNFLKNSASQLTIYGLFSLQDELKERELCVFFRNNHFNTMFKFEGELYILVTDLGYINEPDLVWEKLNEVNGDTIFVTSNFKKFKVDSHETCSWSEQNAMANTADFLARIDNTDINSDLQLAIALQQQEFEQQQQQHQQQQQQQQQAPRVLPQSPTTSRSGLVVGPQNVHPSRPRRQETKAKDKDKCIVM